MSARIRKLPAAVVDRIAAGEVVERPASVVKELVENALDAGASRVEVEVQAGGRDLIVVRDDGVGMGPEDLALAFVSHATSKLADVSDLDHIASFGFRGEALASIGAVADCRIVSRERGAAHGHAVGCEGGVVGDVEPVGAPEGTRVEVRHLFRHVPARRKFLRTPGTEMSHVAATLHELALAHPDSAMALLRGGEAVFRVSCDEDRRARIARFFGRALFDALLPVAAESDGVRLEGHVARPEAARASASWMHFFLNGRPIRDRALAHAVRHAYEGLLTRGRHPVVFLFVDIHPSRVDVNVHPAKSEVRFQDAETVHRLVRRGVRDALLSDGLSPAIVPDAVREGPGAPASPYLEGVRDALTDFLRERREPPPDESLFRRGAGGGAAPADTVSGTAPESPLEPRPRPVGRFLQVRDTFLVFEVDDGIAIVDQHALHERIRLEEIKARVAQGQLEVQPLLVPALVELPAADAAALLAEADALEQLGVRLAPFGETTVAVHALPSMLSRRDPGTVVLGLAERVRAGRGAGSRLALLDDLMHSMACRSAVMAGDALTAEQIAELMRRADLIDNPQSCAHGRPTSLRVTFKELLRHFKR